MLSKQLLRQYEAASLANDRSLAANEKALDLLEKQLERAMDQNDKLEKTIEGVRYAILPVLAEMRDAILKHTTGLDNHRRAQSLEENKKLVSAIEKVADVAGIPRGTTPTVEELLAEARSDPARRAAVEEFMREAEFADTEINYHT